VFLVVQTSEVPGNSLEVLRIAAGTQPPGKSSKVPSFLEIQTYKASRIRAIVKN
jgi:hypothetical protein